MLVPLDDVLGFDGYAIDDQTYDVYSYKGHNGIKLVNKPYKLCNRVDKDGYHRVRISNEGMYKDYTKHYLIVKLFIDLAFDNTKYDIDHKNHIRTDNRPENLVIVSRRNNNLNKTSINRVRYVFEKDIGESITIDNDIEYSISLDKFYRFIHHANLYREMYEKHHSKNMYYINWRDDNRVKRYLNVTKYRQELQSKLI